MRENFEPSLERVLTSEGGYSNHPLDKGGPTNQGITLKGLQEAYEEFDYGDFDNDGDVDVQDVILMKTPDMVAPIYKKHFWDVMRLDEFPAGLDYIMFDFGVNSGPRNAVKILQRSMNALGTELKEDGGLGPKTFQAMIETDVEQLIPVMGEKRFDFYNAIVRNNPDQKVFFKGRMNRLDYVMQEVKNFV